MEDLARLRGRIVGRRRELELVWAALAAGRHVVLEGPPGTGKSTLLRAVAEQLGVGFEFVEGNAELTPARLVGHFDPARVLAEGYDPDVFVDGPLVSAIRDGSLLYIEELNRIPEETLNVLVTVMSEGEVTVPRLGTIAAAPGFRLVAAMNPFDAIGTARISGAIYDRVCRLAVQYQSAEEEQAIVARVAPDGDPTYGRGIVEVVRRTRHHPELRTGSSVRGAIDATLVRQQLETLRRRDHGPDSGAAGDGAATDGAATDGGATDDAGLEAALMALSGRVRLREGGDRTTEDVIAEIYADVFRTLHDGDGDGDPDGDAGDDGSTEGKAPTPPGAPADPVTPGSPKASRPTTT